MSDREVYDVLRRVRGAGINVIANYIFGLPEDDRETMQVTLDLALDLRCEFANFYSAMAYPGSPLYVRRCHPRRPAQRLPVDPAADRVFTAGRAGWATL